MVYYVAQAGAALMGGTSPFIISLGIENFVDLQTAYMLYNYVSVAFLLFVAAAAGAKAEARMCIVLPIFAGIFTMFGWLHAPDEAQTYAVVIIAGLLGVAIYMNEQNREKYGTAGPGNKLMNIVYFIVLFQVAMGIVAGMSLFSVKSNTGGTNMCVVGNNTWGAQCDANGMVDISSSVTSISRSGGLAQDLISIGALIVNVGVALLQMFLTIATAIVAFPLVLNSVLAPIFPGITANSIYLVFLAGLEAVCVINFGLLVFTWFYKPTPWEPL